MSNYKHNFAIGFRIGRSIAIQEMLFNVLRKVFRITDKNYLDKIMWLSEYEMEALFFELMTTENIDVIDKYL